MLRIRWTQNKGWSAPKITNFQNFQIHPAAKVLHYAQELFEGMKAFRGVDGKIRLFRPEQNMSRMTMGAKRACLPIFDEEEFLQCICNLVQIDQDWVPNFPSSSLYIRPTMIGIGNQQSTLMSMGSHKVGY